MWRRDAAFPSSSDGSNPNVFSTVELEVSENLYTDHTDLTVNSVVELTLNDRNAYGIIRWTGTLPERMETMAGIELVKGTPHKHALPPPLLESLVWIFSSILVATPTMFYLFRRRK